MIENGRYVFLDSTRGLAALVVLLVHTAKTFGDEFSSEWTNRLFPADAAVLYFFVLSGFVLAASLEKVSPAIENLISFYGRRMFRIYPAFLVALFLTWLCFPLLSNKIEWLGMYWNKEFYLSDIINQSLLIVRIPNDPSLRLLPHDWTLSIELMLSVLLPFLVIASRNNVFFPLILTWTLAFFKLIDPFIFDFTFGLFIFFKLEYLKDLWKKMNVFGHIFILITALILIYLKDLLPIAASKFNIILIHHKAVGCAILIYVLISSSRLQNFLENRFLLFTGKISYSLYIFHLPLIAVIHTFFPDLNFPFSLILVLILSILLSALTFKFIEQPFMLFSKRIFLFKKEY